MTNAEYKAALEACDFRNPDQVSPLITSQYTDIRFDQKVIEKHNKSVNGGCNYFTGYFGTEEWPDGAGQTLEREVSHDPYIPVTFSHFIKTMQVCDPNLANECFTDYCQIPEGGRSTLPSISMYKTGFKTPRDCIANIRHIREFWYWAKKTVEARFLIDDAIMNLFSTFAAIRTLAHKYILQGVPTGTNEFRPITNSDPRNAFGMFAYNYMKELFPRPTNVDNILPLTTDYLDILARHWTMFPGQQEVAVGARGQKIWEFWYSDDWYQEEAIRNPDYMEKLKITMPGDLFAGYSLSPGREVIGNWAMRCMPWLPRFTESTEGGIIMVDTHEAVPVEVGNEYVGTRDFLNAPFGMAMMPSPRQGKLLTRPTLSQSGAGFPITPITGNGAWRIRNDYDKDCNPDLNQPFSQKRFEMGFQVDSAEGLGIIYRRRVFRTNPVNSCDFQPIVRKVPNTTTCELTTVGCEDNKRRASDSIVEDTSFTWVECSSTVCGQGGSAPYLYYIKTERDGPNGGPNSPGFNFLGCDCGDPVVLAVHDGNGVFVKQIEGVIMENRSRYPFNIYYIQSSEALADGQCIKGIMCSDTTPLEGNVIDAWDSSMVPGTVGVGMTLDSPIDCEVGATVHVNYFDVNGHTVGSISGTLAAADHTHNEYRVTSATPNFKVQMFPGQVRMGLSCWGGGSNSHSSSSSSSSDS